MAIGPMRSMRLMLMFRPFARTQMGSHIFSVKSQNGHRDSNIITLNLSVNGANDAPRLTVSAASDNNVTEAGHNGTGEIVAGDQMLGQARSSLLLMPTGMIRSSLKNLCHSGTAPVDPTDGDTAINLGSGDAENATSIEALTAPLP